MSHWKVKIQNLVGEIDDFSDSLRTRLRRIGDFDDDLTIVPYIGYGTADKFTLRGRVLEDKGAIAASSADSRWENLRNMYRRFATDEIAGRAFWLVFKQSKRKSSPTPKVILIWS
jgi:hypothetical protein